MHIEEETQEERPGSNLSPEEVHIESNEVGAWSLPDMSRNCQNNERGGSLISSTGSTGSVESIDSHQSHM